MFVDHASGFLHVEFQTHLNTHETLEAKEKFELMCHDNGVIPQSYLTDNGSAFTSAGYTSKLREFAQVMRFAGAGAHHHNGISERAIQTTMSVSRTMMLHAAIHWRTFPTQPCGLWPLLMLSSCTTTSPTLRQASLLLICSRELVGSNDSFMTCMFGAVLCTFLTRLCPTARSSLAGALVRSVPSTWACLRSMQAQCPFS